jgi:hypothetical protein
MTVGELRRQLAVLAEVDDGAEVTLWVGVSNTQVAHGRLEEVQVDVCRSGGVDLLVWQGVVDGGGQRRGGAARGGGNGREA